MRFGAGLLALLLAPAASSAQTGAASGRASGLTLVVSRLLLLPSELCDVRYSPGTLDRAATAQEWLCELTNGAGRALNRATPIEALLLTREEWEQGGLECPYGLPCLLGPGALALPATGDPGTVELWTATLGALPPLPGVPLVGTVDEVASLAPADALASAVVARELVAAAGFVGEERSVIELLGHALFLEAARRGESGRGEAMSGFWAAMRGLPSSPEGTVAGGVAVGALRDELRRQAGLFAAAEGMVGRAHRFPGRRLWRLQEKAGGTLRAADLRAGWPEAFAALEAAAPPGPSR